MFSSFKINSLGIGHLLFSIPVIAMLFAAGAQAQTFYWNPNSATFGIPGEIQKSYHWTSNQDGTGYRPTSSLDDDFSGSTLGSGWTYLDSIKDGNSGYSLTTKSGKLYLSGRGADVWTGSNAFAAIYRNTAYTGNFDVTVEVDSQGNTNAWAKAGILVFNDFNNAGSGGAFLVTVTPSNGFAVHFDTTSTVGRFDSPSGSVGTAVYPCWLRAVRTGNTFAGYYKTSIGGAWNLISVAGISSHTSQNTGSSSQVGLFVTSHTTTATTTAVFDNFEGGGEISATGLDLNFGGTSATSDDASKLGGNLTAKSVDFSAYPGAFSFQTFTLTLSGNATFPGNNMTLNAGTGTLAFNGTSGAQLFTPIANVAFPTIAKSGADTVQIQTTPFKAAGLVISGGAVNLNSKVCTFGGLVSSGGLLKGLTANDSVIFSGDADFTGLTSIPSLGAVIIKDQGAGTNLSFNPGGKTFNNLILWPYPSGVSTNRITIASGALAVNGTLTLRDERANSGALGILDFNASNTAVTVNGDVNRVDDGTTGTSSLSLLMGGGIWSLKANMAVSLGNSGSAGASTVKFVGTAGTQTVNVSNGSLNIVNHTGTGTMKLGAALGAASLTQSAGILDFNGFNLTTTGNLQVTNGTPTTLANLDGRTLTVGSAAFLGSSGSLLDLNTATGWTINAASSLTADYATIAKSNAGSIHGTPTANCTDGGGNTHWDFPTPTSPALVTREPVDTTVASGAPAGFTVHATGTATVTYEWYRRGNPAVLSTDTLYNLSSPTLSDNGALFFCIVTNAYGKDTTRDAKLTVNQAALVVGEPRDTTVNVGQNGFFSVSATGSSTVTYAWYRKGNPTVISTTSSYTLTAASLSDNGAIFYCIVANGFGKDTTREATLNVTQKPVIVNDAKDTAVLLGANATFYVSAAGSGPLTYQWRRSGPDSTILISDSVYTLSPTKLSDDGATFYCTISNAYGTVTSRAAKLTVGQIPSFTREPADTTVSAGQKAIFSASAQGTTPLVFEWRKTGNPALLGNDTVFTLNTPALSDNGSAYYCIVSNAYGKDTTRSAKLTVTQAAKIAVDPKDVTVAVGSKAVFTVSATGTSPITFQWRRKGDSTVIGTDSVYTLDSAKMTNDSSFFNVTATNAFGSAVSRDAKLSVTQASVIVLEPQDTTLSLGQKAVFKVRAVGSAPMTFAWRRKGDSTVVGIDSILTVDSVKAAQTGWKYYVVVSNAFGKDTSREAQLTVRLCDSLFQVTPDSVTVDEGQPVSLNGMMRCASSIEWSIVSGPAPRILDPEVDTLNFTAPRVAGDSVIIYRFTGYFATGTQTKDVKVTVRDAIPDPQFTLPAKSTWDGKLPLVLRPTLTNAQALKLASYNPPLRYLWNISLVISDTAQAGDSLTLSKPSQNGSVDVTLCMDNGGVSNCGKTTIDIALTPVSLMPRGISLGPVALDGNVLIWRQAVRVRVWNWQGRILWESRGVPGSSATLSQGLLHALYGNRARLEIMP